MNNAVMLSIKPEWCEKISNGEKTIEVRKTAPKLKPPFKCYIYETLGTKQYFSQPLPISCSEGRGKVIGEFVCDRFFPYCQAKPIENEAEVERWACLTREEIWKYAPSGNPVGWHISNLVIYDKPKALSEFYKNGTLDNEAFIETLYDGFRTYAEYLFTRVMRKPPQSWCYVEELGGST